MRAVGPKRSRLDSLALSPLDEAYKSLCGRPGSDDKAPMPVDRTLYVFHEIEEHMALAFDSLMRALCAEEETDDILLILNTPGGNTIDGLAMYDAVSAANASGNHVLAVVRGCAMSMGGVLLQAARTRKMTANSYLMIHQGWGDLFGNVGEVKRDVAWWDEMETRCNRILAARSTLTAKEIAERITSGNWYLNAKEALKYGFVDEVL